MNSFILVTLVYNLKPTEMSNILKSKKAFLLLLIITSLSSCLTNVDEEEAVDPCTTITYTINVKPIIDNNCIQCHGNGGNFPNLTTFTGTSANAAIVKDAVVTKRMPQGGLLTNEEISSISCWVDGGALNN